MNAGKVLIGTAMLVFSVALLVSPSGAAPSAFLPGWQELAAGADTVTTGPAFPAGEDGTCRWGEPAARCTTTFCLQPDPVSCRLPVQPAMGCP